MKNQVEALSFTTVNTNDLVSQVIPLGQIYTYAVQCAFGGTSPVGSLTVQGSNDQSQWDTVSTTAVSATGHTMINQDGAGYAYLRVYYAYTSGAVSLSGTFSVKGP